MSEVQSASNLRGLEESYDIRGELRGIDSARQYIGTTRDGTAEVAIAVFQVPKGGENNALSHFAADAQILARTVHPAIPRVIEGRWVGADAFGVVSERSHGETLGELLERGEKFTNARIAMLLTEVSGVLDWARDNGVVHRGVTPDSLMFERGTNRLRIMLTPTPIPITGVPDACADARTIGKLAWAMLTGTPYPAADAPKSIADVCPNLATRVVDATDRMIACKGPGDAPNVDALLSVIAAGDALKQAEIELAAMKEEYDEAHQREIQKCEIQRQETEQHAAEQAAILAGEREEFQRQMAEQRSAMDAERAEFERIMTERKERFTAVRAELDQQRIELERRLSELETYRTEVEKVRDEALAARDAAKAEMAKAEAEKKELMKMSAAAAAASAAAAAATPAAGTDIQPSASRSEIAVPIVPEMPEPVRPTLPRIEPGRAEPPRLAKPPKPPKWKQIQPVDLDHTDEENIPEPGARPRWLIPSAVGTLVLIAIAILFGMTHRSNDSTGAIKLGNSTVVPTAPTTTNGIVPRGGFLTQSAGGALAPKFNGTPTATTPAAPDTASPRPLTQHEVDSIAAIQQRIHRQLPPPQPVRRKPTQAEIDSMNAGPEFWNRPARRDTAARRRDTTTSSAAPTVAPIVNGTLPPVSTVKRDSAPRRDTLPKRDTIKPDTTAGY